MQCFPQQCSTSLIHSDHCDNPFCWYVLWPSFSLKGAQKRSWNLSWHQETNSPILRYNVQWIQHLRLKTFDLYPCHDSSQVWLSLVSLITWHFVEQISVSELKTTVKTENDSENRESHMRLSQLNQGNVATNTTKSSSHWPCTCETSAPSLPTMVSNCIFDSFMPTFLAYRPLCLEMTHELLTPQSWLINHSMNKSIKRWFIAESNQFKLIAWWYQRCFYYWICATFIRQACDWSCFRLQIVLMSR